jgi:CBS domain-containing protein
MEVLMRVFDVMTRRVISVAPDARIEDAISLMLKHHISGLPVIDRKGKLVGMVTESDFLRRAETGTEKKRSRWLDAFFGPGDAAMSYIHCHGSKVRDVMTRGAVTIKEDAKLDDVVHLMESRRIKRLPVVRRGKVVGIVSRANLMRSLASLRHAVPALSKNDTAIRDRIITALYEQTWSSGADVEITVRDGIADIWGTVTDPMQRDAVRVLVETAPGVKRIENHLTWQDEPTSVT